MPQRSRSRLANPRARPSIPTALARLALAAVALFLFAIPVAGAAEAKKKEGEPVEKYRVTLDPVYATVRPGGTVTFTPALELHGVRQPEVSASTFLYDASGGRFEGNVYHAPRAEGNYKIVVAHPKVFRSGVGVAFVKVAGEPVPPAVVSAPAPPPAAAANPAAATTAADAPRVDLANLTDPRGKPLLEKGPAAPAAARLRLDPGEVTLRPGETFRFRAMALDAAGRLIENFAPTWDSTGGEMTPGGLYRAGEQEGDFFVGITDPATFNRVSALVRIARDRCARIVLTPARAVAKPGERVAFQAAAFDAAGRPAPAAISWRAVGGGTVDAQGRFTAPRQEGATAVVFATDQATGVFGHAVITVDSTRASRLEIVPGAAVLGLGEQMRFAAAGFASDGAPVPVAVRWLATDGAITADGLFTAPSKPRDMVQIVAIDDRSGSVALATVRVR
ncbi:MAG: hypothetical protein HY719_17215 [Planctomycetes bacterium]|nr:hypothetical protein [Planctomycetota bacterium]